MSDLSEESLRQLGKLCRLEISEEELHPLFNDLKRIVDYIEQLKEVDVSHLSPYSHIEEQGVGSLREDEVTHSLPRETFLKNSPDHVGGMIRVPLVIKDRS